MYVKFDTVNKIADLLAALKSQKAHLLLATNSFILVLGIFVSRNKNATGLVSLVPSAIPPTCTDTTWLPTTVLDTTPYSVMCSSLGIVLVSCILWTLLTHYDLVECCSKLLAEEKMQSSNFVINLLIVQHLMLIAVILVSLWNTKVHVWTKMQLHKTWWLFYWESSALKCTPVNL